MRRIAMCMAVMMLVWGTADAQTGGLRIQTVPPGADIEVNGNPERASPVEIEGLTPGQHLLVVRKAGFHEVRRTIPVLAGQQVPVEITLEELNGLLLIHTTPPGADVQLGSVFRGKTPLMLPNLPLGTHRVQLTAPGYFPRDIEVTLDDRTPRWIRESLQADAAVLEINSEPAGARVTVNGSDRGATPVRLDRVASGDAEVAVTLEGYAPYRETVKLAAGGNFIVNAVLREQPGILRVDTTPAGARVYIDNQFRGESPLVLDSIPSGDRRVRVDLKGYESDARTVRVRAGESVTEEFKLASNSGVLVLVTEPPGVKVMIDGVEAGETRAQAAGLVSDALRIDSLARGEHTVQLVRPGYEAVPRKIFIEPGRAVTLNEKLKKVFSPDTRLMIRDEAGNQMVITGQQLQRHPDGDIEIETRPGVIRRIPAATIIDRQTIKAP